MMDEMMDDKNDREDGSQLGNKYDAVISKKIYVSVGTQTETQEEGQTAIDVMWHIIEKGMGLNIPVYLKNIMSLEGYDTPIAIEKMSADTTKELELFGRTEMLKFIKEGEKYSDYFNKYHICPSEFRIPTGHKALLAEIQKFVANKLSTDRMYFMPELRLKKSSCQSRKLAENFNQKQKVYASRVASKPPNKDLDEGSLPNSSQHTNLDANSRSNSDTSTDINLNAEHDSLYALIMVWLKKQSKVSI